MNILGEFKKLTERLRKGEETVWTIVVRPFLFPNYLFKKAVKVLNEDWDYLIVLDACRYDYFWRYNTLPGRLIKKISAGTHTVDWANQNFKNSDCSKIVYISPTPQISRFKLSEIGIPNTFYHLEEIWDKGWSEELGTVLPERINETALRLIKKYPNKRFIIHYIQPHSPFIGDPQLGGGFRWQDEVKNGKMNIEEVKKAYVGNLKLVLKYVKKLFPHLEGKVVVTSDHGEAFGELGMYSHPPRMYIKPLLEIPWLVVDQKPLKHSIICQKIDEKESIRDKIKELRIKGKI